MYTFFKIQNGYSVKQDTSRSHINFSMMKNPDCILLFSGKRKSGKDYITDRLHNELGDGKCIIIKLSGPIKSHWAQAFNLDLNELLSDGKYKEEYRLRMVKWGEEIRKKDYGYFCRASIEMYKATNKSIWIVSDIRRKTDIQWFTENYGSLCRTIRVKCDDKIREQRGWIFTPGVDDSETECNLDDVEKWDLEIINEGESIENIVETILKIIG